VWNEPDCSIFWKGTPEQYADLARRACKIVHTTRKGARVLVGAFTGACDREWLQRAVRAGALEEADGLSFHAYNDTLDGFEEIVAFYTEIARSAFGPERRPEIWITEWGVRDTTFFTDADWPNPPPRRLLPPPSSWLDGAARTVKMDAAALAFGIRRSFFHLWNEVSRENVWENRSAIDYTRVPRPKLLARVAFESLVRKRSCIGRRRVAGGRVEAVLFDGPGDVLLLLWAANIDVDAAPLSVTSPDPDAAVLDIFANNRGRAGPVLRLTGVPIWLRTRLQERELEARLNAMRVSE